MKNVMIDLETMGTRAGCVILSIGAVEFDENGIGREFYTTISQRSCVYWGLTIDPETEEWWRSQNEEARKVLVDSITTNTSLPMALNKFGDFFQWCKAEHPWGNGADFDLPILNAAYANAGLELPWKFYNSRCYRTLKNMYPSVQLSREGTYHNALDDARSQAKHAVGLMRAHAAREAVQIAAE